jgi:hypothetical protein
MQIAKYKQCKTGKPSNGWTACGSTTVGFVLLLELLALLFSPFAHSSSPDTCIQGYVWREAYPGDHVCVTPDLRKQAATDNQLAGSLREPQGGAYGPDTCKPGFVWREARPQDHVCVTPEARTQTARDNSLAHTRRVVPPAAANGRTSAYGSYSTPNPTLNLPKAAPKTNAPAPASAMETRARASSADPVKLPKTEATATAPATLPATASMSMARSFKLPEFPWPPPPFSTRLKLDRALLVAGQSAPTNGSVAARMEQVLAANGYTPLSYYAVPDGFAIVTQIERIDARAAPAAEQRWSTQVPPVIPFNLEAYIRALLGKDGDSFRVIAFVFTPTPFTTSGRPVAPGEAMAWVEKGATALPAALAAQPYGNDTVCTALVYEFRFSSLGASTKRPGVFSGEQHLRAAGILKALERAP